MNPKIFVSSEPITLVGGGALGAGDLEAALALAPGLVAADGGANHLLGHLDRLLGVVGDLDSLSCKAVSRLPGHLLHRIDEQESTDFDKALRSIEAPLIIGVGFMGGRVDHQLAALNVLVRRAHRPVVLLSESEVILHMPRRLQLDVQANDTVSLMPFAGVSGRSSGLNWPIDGLGFAPNRRIGTSNRALGPVDLRFDQPGMIGLIPRARLGAVARALLALPDHARWHARAE